MSLLTIERRIAQFETSPPVETPPPNSAFLAFAQTGSRRFGAATTLTPPVRSLTADADRALAERAAVANGVDPALVLGVIQNESAFDAGATSAAGAMGLMQLMPETARALGVSDPYDPAQNVAAGTAYLRDLLQRFGGNAALAVAAYNAGPQAVENHGGIPPYPETQRYVGAVLSTAARWRTR